MIVEFTARIDIPNEDIAKAGGVEQAVQNIVGHTGAQVQEAEAY